VRRLAQTLEELSALRADMIRRTERQMVQLALAIASRLVHREITIDRGLLAGMARVALDRLGEHASATIRLHPDDYLAVTSVQTAPWASEQVRLVADPQVSRGGCLVQSDFGFMDASADAQIHELARLLLEDTESRAEPATLAGGNAAVHT
jgi:flagellar assembly protein FliH